MDRDRPIAFSDLFEIGYPQQPSLVEVFHVRAGLFQGQ